MRGNGESGPIFKKSLLILLLILFSISITCYFHLIRGVEVVYTHVFYLPIVLTGLWFGKKALPISLFLAISLFVFHIFSRIDYPLTDDFLRGAMFVTVGYVLGMVVEEKNNLHAEAINEKNGRIEQMENHAKYVEEVAHGLRNPLQVLRGALDTVEMEKLNSGQKELITMINEAAGEMGKKIKELTEARGPKGKEK